MNDIYRRIISITELRRNFGEITKELPFVESLILTKGGEPFAELKAVPGEKKKVMMGVAGAWKNTELDKDKLWEKVFERKSRRRSLVI